MDEMRTTNQVEEVNKHLKEIPKEAEERRIENQPQTGKNEKAIEPFQAHRTCRKSAGLIWRGGKKKQSMGIFHTLLFFWNCLLYTAGAL